MPTNAEVLQRIFPSAQRPEDLPQPVYAFLSSYYELADRAEVSEGIPTGVLLSFLTLYFAGQPTAVDPQSEVARWGGEEQPAERGAWGEQPVAAAPQSSPTFLKQKKASPLAGTWLNEHGQPIARRYPVVGEFADVDLSSRIPQGVTQPMQLTPEQISGGTPVTFVHPRLKVLATGILLGQEGDSVTVRTRNDQLGNDEELVVPITDCKI